VDPFSCQIGNACGLVETLQGDHRSLCRYDGLDDENFEKVQRVIRGYVCEIEISTRARPGM
jgi:hypothetical protein